MLAFFAGAVVGALIGLVVTVVAQPPVERWYRVGRAELARRVHRQQPPPSQDLEEIGFHQFVSWSGRRPLDPLLHRVHVDRELPGPQAWFEDDQWVACRDEFRSRVPGMVSHVAAYTVDHGEAGLPTRAFELTVRPCAYADGVAVQHLLADDHNWARVRRIFLDRGAREAIRMGPSQAFFVTLTLVTADGQCLALRRASGAVATSGGLWSLGACETMGAIPDRPGCEPEDLFDLAYRAAAEEFGIDRDDLGPIWFTWFGYTRLDGPMAVAHVRTVLSAVECLHRIRDAEGAYEADAIRWLAIDSPDLRQLSSPALHAGWLPFTCIVARDLLAVSKWLAVEPARRW